MVPVSGESEEKSLPSALAPALSDTERNEILVAWNDTRVEFPDVCAHELFERQVDRDPHAVALIFEEQRLTYRELNQRANQVAHFLRKHGVGPESLVGVSLKRCPELVVALLGVWKAGGAYVPLDPAYPPERLAFMVGDAGVRMLLTDASCKPLFPSVGDKAVCLDTDWPTIEQEEAGNPGAGAVPSNLAYVMYTSGSTGQPKGAMILHGGLVNYLCWAIQAYGVQAGGSVPVHSSISFDLTVTSLYPILLAGGHAELLPEDAGAQNLLAALRRCGNRSLVKITPAHLDLLGQQLRSDEIAELTKTFVIGGENLLAESVQVWRDFAPSTRLINEYGPTETVVGCCVYEVKPDDPRSGSIPIGRPIANTQLYILDPDMQPVPLGETGELYIGGAGVARGYLNRPELTQERFLVDRFSGRDGARLYKTGDLARYRPDGILEYLGRVDNQVKIRGYRIELGEIEAILAGHPEVQSCAVLAREDSPGNKQLVGYVVSRGGGTPAVEGMSDFLKMRLPEYMVPAQFVLLESLPLTQNGKVDRKALPAPSEANLISGETTVAPRNDTERALADIWAKLLNVGSIGIHDDFFELGGHSLLVIKAMSRIRDVLQVDLPPQSLFENSTVAGLAAVVMQAKGDAAEEPSQDVRRIEPREEAGPCPLSFAQEQFWLLDQMVPGSPAYNIVDVIALRGEYDAEAMKGTLNEIVRRHEILRTAFSPGDGQLMQVVLPPTELPLLEFDLTSLPEPERAPAWSSVVREQGHKAFDLSEAPLLRATMVHHSATDHRLLLVIHHIVGDEWAMGLIQDEVRQIYAAFSRKLPSPLGELPVQYADFACWQRDWFQGERLEEQIAYWKEALAGASPVLALPTDKPRPPAQTFRGATEHFTLPKALLERLRALGLKEQTTLFMLLEAAFASLLYRYSGQADILVGTPISGRTQSETQRLVGCFLNTVVLRSQFDDGQTFRTLLRQTRGRALGAFAHAELPFGRLVATLAPDRDASRTPLFQVMFVLFDPDGASRISNVAGHRELETGTSKFDLTLFLSMNEDGLAGEMEYSTDLFEADTVRRLCGHFGVLLEALAGDPDQPIARLPLLTEADRQQLLVEWNRTESEYPRDVPLAQLIEAQVERTPDAVALVCSDESLTFAELNAWSNQLAYELRARGVGPDRLVGICMERSVDMVVGLLAIVKAGAAYLPLDPLLPPERLGTMIEDSGARLVLTQESLWASLPAFSGTVLLLDDKSWKSNPRDNLGVAAKPDHLAYVIYTSGSTGKPKGVEVPRGALTNLLWSMREWLGLTAADRLLAVTTISFDIAGVDMWLPLLVGARMVVASREEAVDGERLGEQIDRHGITFLQATPVTWRLLLAAGWKGKSDLQIVCTGEAMPRDLAALLLPRVRRLWNLYGPTETTIWSTGYRVRDGDEPVLIGRPVANTQCYILDQNRRPVPVGAVGELYIGGDGLARGYLGRPELTAEKFVPDPFRNQAGARMYRTGDLACYRSDGNLVCLGRSDHQVKIRGFRVELGEIEAGIARHPSIRQVVVVAREDVPGDKRLVAYFVAEEPPTDLIEQLHRQVRALMPEYMVPSHFVALEALPLSPNGKVDRKALPAPSGDDAVVVRESVGPRNQTEAWLVSIWSELLGVATVGIDDNFFELGGHSLLAIKAMSRIRDAFKVDLPLRRLFESPTVAGIAAAVMQAQGSTTQRPRIERRQQGGPCPVSFAQEQFWLLDQAVPGSPAYNIVDTITLQGDYDADALTGALNEMLRRHEILRTAFVLTGGQLLQVVSPTIVVSPAEYDLSALPDTERWREWERLVRAEGRRPFDLAEPPLIRAAVIHHSASDHRVLLTVHHIVADEWAMGLIQDEAKQLYAALSRKQPSSLPELSVQYADFACWQREWFQGEQLDEQVAYWKEVLSGASPVLALPTDKPRPAMQTFRGTTEHFALPKALLERLRALGRKEQTTLFMLLEAAFASLLYRYSGQADILVGTPISGRTQSETQRLVGCFLNTVVLRSQFDDGQTFRALLRQTRERALGAFAHAELPFGRLVATLGPDRDPSRSPLFQVMFILLDADGGSQASKVFGHRELETGTSKFDLTLLAAETKDGLEGMFEYSTDLFEAETIWRLCGHFGVLLEALVGDPDQPISRLPMLTEADRQQLLVEWNDTDTVFPEAGLCLHELFTRQAQRTPEAVAVLDGRDAMTYGELDRRSNQLAHHLMELGVGPDVLVGLLVERSAEMMVALLSILKAGGAYVPLDPGFPSERLDHMVSNSKMPVLITQGELAQMLHVHPSAIVRLDLDRDAIANHGVDTPVPLGLGGSHLAYVLYTSGSTGVPKGVAIPHSAIVNFLLSMQREPGFTAADTILAVTTLSFDIAGLELYLPLVSGAKVAIASRDDAMDPYRLMDRLREHGCTMLQATPATWRALLTAGWSGSPGLKALCGGEAMPLDLARELLPRCAELWNMYGPTETTVWSTVYRITSAESQAPIGRPIANTQTYVLDRNGQLVPPGVVGELYIGGSGLARGYLYRPELTQERFVPSSFAPDARLYRTGDLARWRAYGILECLGRSDHQVKIRGFRVELGEIEAGIARHPSIRQVVVVAREDVPGDKRLVAYFVAEEPPSDLVEQLRRQVRALMPEYMLPSHFLALEAFPLSPNGKIDRKALPAPSGDDAVVVCEGVGPRNQTEALLASIWSELLGVAKVGIDDNFFELGGHSLLAIKAMSRVRDAFKVDLPLRRLFEDPTVAGIAAAVMKAKGATSPVQRIEPRKQPGPYPLSFAQEQFWLLDQMVPGSPAYNIVDVIDLDGAYHAQALQGALRELVRRHEILRTAFTVEKEGLRQVVLPGGELPVPEIELTALPEGERADAWNRVVREQGRQPFDLAQPPLLRAAMVHHSATEHRLLIVLHHIVGDEWAMGLVQEEVKQAYAALSRAQPFSLPELPVQYADYACWQREWFQGEKLEAQLDYWREALAGTSPVLLLPTDKPRPPALTFRGATEQFVLPKTLLEELRTLGKQEQTTLFMVLEAAFASLLHRYSGQSDLLVGTPISGRTQSETQHLVGCFLNTVVLRSQLDDGQTFRSLLHQTRERALGAFAHAEIPFARLVATLAPERDPSRTPLFQAMFVLLDPDSASRSSILSGHRELETGTSKFDMTLFISITKDGLVGEMEYSTDLFEAETIRRMCRHFGVLLEGLAHRPDQPIGRLPILTEADTQQLLVEWNRTESDYPRAEPLAQLIEAQVARTPEAVAVVYGDEALTYAELDASANQLAHELRARGVGPDRLVGICIERSLDLVVGLLAIIKAGGAYLPLDPFLPAERLRTMLEDSGTTLVLTQDSLRATLPAFAGSPCSVDDPSWRSRPRDNPSVAVAPEQLAYVIYTSGSTGKPKGVEVPRGALTNLLWSMRDWLGLTAAD